MQSISDIWLIKIQCKSISNQTGTFLVSHKTGQQVSETYKSLSELLESNSYKFAKSHGIRILWPGYVESIEYAAQDIQ